MAPQSPQQSPAPFGSCNVVVIDSCNLKFAPVMKSPLLTTKNDQSSFPSWEYGTLVTFPTEQPTVTQTQLPFPLGRGSNQALQKASLSVADVFLVIVHTNNYYHDWAFGLAKEHPNTPVICWINRGFEERSIAVWKQQERRLLINLKQVQDRLEENKNDQSMSQKVYLPVHNNSNPVVPLEQIYDKLKTNLPSSPIFEVDVSSLPDPYLAGPKQENEEQKIEREKKNEKIKEELRKVHELAKQVQKERGMDEEVQKMKQKTLSELVSPPKPKKTSWLSQIGSKLRLKAK